MTDIEALEYGQRAYQRGLKCAPVLDTEFIEALPVGFNPRVKLLKAWTLGWTAQNLVEMQQPVEKPYVCLNCGMGNCKGDCYTDADQFCDNL